jgi:hypothetical protein
MLAIGTAMALLTGTFGVTGTAHAEGTYVNRINNHADDCSGGNHWANTSFDRSTKIVKVTDNPGPKDDYKVTIKDEGTFTTIWNAPSLFDDNVHELRTLTGSFTGGATYDIKGELKAYNPTGDVFDDTNTQGKNCAGAWPKVFFKTGYTGGINNDWGWTYKSLDETMVNAAAGNSGNITAKLTSKLTATNWCRISKTNKANRWVVKNVQGDRSRTFSYWVKYGNTYSAHFSATVAPGGQVVITTPFGGRLTVSYYDGYTVNKRVYVYSNHLILC